MKEEWFGGPIIHWASVKDGGEKGGKPYPLVSSFFDKMWNERGTILNLSIGNLSGQ